MRSILKELFILLNSLIFMLMMASLRKHTFKKSYHFEHKNIIIKID